MFNREIESATLIGIKPELIVNLSLCSSFLGSGSASSCINLTICIGSFLVDQILVNIEVWWVSWFVGKNIVEILSEVGQDGTGKTM